jgi:hypothetical protein
VSPAGARTTLASNVETSGNASSYRIARLKRDHPAIAEALARGDPDDVVITDNVSNNHKRNHEHGTSRTYALRKLRKDAPAIHARVLAGDLSPHAGMLEAGFRHKPTPLETLHTVWRKVSPDERIKFLIEMMTPEERRTVLHGLDDEETPDDRD